MKIQRRKPVRASSDGSEMLNNLYELTKGMWFEPMDKFSDVVYNADEIIPVIDYDECVEFGTNNGQELLIYDEVNGRKHIRYSCSMTTIFDELVLTNVWDKSGQLYECDYDAIYDELAEKNNFNGDVDFSSSVRASYKPAPRKRAIKADEYYPENYADMGYEGLDSAIQALYNLRRNAEDLMNQIDDYMDSMGIKYDASGLDGEFIEMFAGPDDAYYFADKVGEISDTVAQCERDFYDLI